MAKTQKVSTCLWFDKDAEEAAKLYTSLLPNSGIKSILHYGKGAPMPEGTVLTVDFTLAGTDFTALNGGPMFKHSEASSTMVLCDDQAEIDRLWTALLANGGTESQCGWLKDRYGLSWQIVPARLYDMLHGGDKTQRMMAALMGMVKLDIAQLEAAYNGA
jgi:predicted 3-demethylubiquinone-9 3-methyltransferase (glyoxalase superfamily)